MLCALTVRRLKPGRLEQFLEVWETAEQPEGWVHAYTVQSLENQNEIVSFGFFDGTLDDLRKAQLDMDYAAWRAKIDPFVDSTGTDGIFEVVSELGG